MANCNQANKASFFKDRRIKIGDKTISFESRDDEFATEIQMEQINNLLSQTYGTRLFNFATIEEYLSKILIQEFGRNNIDLNAQPITQPEAQFIISDLARMTSLLKKGNKNLWVKKKLLTPEKFLSRNAVTRSIYERHQKDMERNVKRKITIWNNIIDDDQPVIVRYNRDTNGQPISQKDVTKTINLLELLDVNKKEKKILRKWVQLKFDTLDGATSQSKLTSFENQNADLIKKAKFFRRFAESGGSVALYPEGKSLGYSPQKLSKAFQNWRDMMDDIFLFDQETVSKWLDAEALDGQTYRDLFKEEFRKELEHYNNNYGNPFKPSDIDKIIEKFNLKPPEFRKNYFTHHRYDISSPKYLASDIHKVISDLKTGRIRPDALLTYARGSQFWLERKEANADIVEDPFTVAETRILSSIQTRKKLMLRGLSLEGIKKLKKEQDRLEAIDASVLNGSGNKQFKKQVQNLLQEYTTMEEYIRLLASDAQGTNRESIVGKFYEKWLFNPESNRNITSPGELDAIVSSISRTYRGLKTSAYLGLSVKTAMTNMQQSVGPVAAEFGFRNMFNAQKDMGFLGAKSKRGTERVFIDSSNNEHVVDVVDQVGIKYDDIMSLMERGIPKLDRDFENLLIKNKQAIKYLDGLEKGIQFIAQKTLENSYVGRLVNFVDVEYRNRSITSLAAYDKRMQQLKKQNISGLKAHNAAIKFARKAVDRLQFEYSVFNRSEFVRGNLGSSVFLFKSFTVNQSQMQFDWTVDVKNQFIVNSKGAQIPLAQLGRFFRWGMLVLLNNIFKYGWKVSVGLLTIESPIMSYISDLYKLIFGDEEEKDQAFFGLKQYGAVNQLFSGAANDFVVLPLMAMDNDLRKRVYSGLWDGLIPAGKQLRNWIGGPNVPFIPGKRPGYFTYLYDPPKSSYDSPVTRIMLDFIAGHPIYTSSSKLKTLNKINR